MSLYDSDPRVRQVNDFDFEVDMPDGTWQVALNNWESGDQAWLASPPAESRRRAFRMRYPNDAVALVLAGHGL